jgi:hypothetical protein
MLGADEFWPNADMTATCERVVGQRVSKGANFSVIDAIHAIGLGAETVLYDAIPEVAYAATGGLTEVKVLAAGLGYSVGDLLTLAQAGGSEANGIVKVAQVYGDGSVRSVVISAAGTAYALGVTATVGSGGTTGSSGATFTVVSVAGAPTLDNETITIPGLAAALAAPGTTYKVYVHGIEYILSTDFSRSGDDITFTPGTVAVGGLKVLTMTDDGVGYAEDETIALSQTGGTEAGGVVTVDTVDGSGNILTYHISAAGTAYLVGALTSAAGSVAGTGAVFTADVVGKWPMDHQSVKVVVTTAVDAYAFACPTAWTANEESNSTGALVVSATTGAEEAYVAMTITTHYTLADQVVTLTAAGVALLTAGTDLLKISHTFAKWNKIPTSYVIGAGEVIKVWDGAAVLPADADTLKTVTTHYVVTDATVVTLEDAYAPAAGVVVTVVLRSPAVVIVQSDFLAFVSTHGGYNYRQFVPAATTAGSLAYV